MRNQKGQLPQAEIILVYVLLGVACLLTAAFYRSHAPEPVKPLLTRTVADLVQVKGKAGEAVDLQDLYNSSPALIAKGKTAYENTCASCHGKSGKGDGMAAAALNPKPRDFHSKDAWINPRTISGIFKTLQEGLPGTAMSAYDYVSVADRFAIIHYIQSMSDYPAASEADMSALDAKYNLSSGEKIPHQIPVAKAMEILVAEASKPVESKAVASESAPSTSAVDTALAAKGKALFMTCAACHSLDGTRRVGPSLKDVFGRDTKLSNGTSVKADETYLENSIKNPNAEVVAGYPPIMTKLPMSDSDVKALVEYLKSLSAPVKKVQAPSTGGVDTALAAKGKALFMTCAACHSLDGTRRVGPSLKDVFGRDTKLSNGKSVKADETYLENSIKNPNAEVVAGYPPIMTKLPMSDSDVKALVEYLKSLSAPVKKVEAPSTGGVDTALAAKGKTLFMTCGACHSLDGTRRVGPSLKGAFGRTSKLANGKSVKADAEYIFNSIKNPNADVVAGYPPIMTKMPFSDEDIKALVEYIKTL